MLTNDQAITLGVRKYREIYPEGVIPKSLEDAAVLNAIPGHEKTTVLMAYFLIGQRDPFILFKAIVDRQSGQVSVETAPDWRGLNGKQLDNSQTVT